MTPQEASRIIAPIRIAFLAARIRLQEQREEARTLHGIAAYRALADLDAAEEFLIAREEQWDFAGMLSAVMHGERACVWPNVVPDPEVMAACLEAWMAGKPGLRAKVELLMRPPSLPLYQCLALRRASGE